MTAMAYRRLHLVPVAVFLLIVVTFIVTYCIAVALDHVEPGFPYISETGSVPPESCIFAQFVNIAAAVLLICVYIRYRQIKEISRVYSGPRGTITPKVNKVAAYFGAFACLGLDVVANFQESNVIVVHLLGAGVCFACGTVFFCMQTVISRRLRPDFNTKFTFYARATISVLCVFFTIMTIIPATIAYSQYKDPLEQLELLAGTNPMRWRQEDGGWEWHLVSTISEWLLVISFCSFILSFSREFKGIVLEAPVIKIEGISSRTDVSSVGTDKPRDETS